MSGDAWVTLAVLLVSLGLLTRDVLAPSAIVLAATVTLLVADVIGPGEAFAGFSNPAPITVAALYVVARGVEKTALLAPITSRILGEHGGRGALARLTLPTAAASGFLNNTPLVAMLIPDVEGWARRRGLPASRFLMPLSFATILGGALTVLGTSTNLVISGLLEESGEPPLGLFEITPVGGPVAIVGLGVLFVAWRLVPDRLTARQQAEEEFRQFTVTMQVEPNGPLAGKTVGEAPFRSSYGVFVLEIRRADHAISPVGPSTLLEGDDRLVFVGRADRIVDLQRAPGLRSAVQEHLDAVTSAEHTFFEAVIGRTSPLAGRTLGEVGFRARYLAAVVAIHRDGQRLRVPVEQVRLRAGDTLLVLAGPDFPVNWKDRRDFLVIAHRGGAPPHATRQAPVVGAIVIAMVAVSALGILPILEASLVAAGALLVAQVLTPNEVREAIDFDVIVLIGAAFGLGAAVETTGLADAMAGSLVDLFTAFGTVGIVFGTMLATSLLTELITNNAAAVVIFPIALSIAGATDVAPRGMAIAVAVAASSSFLTPIGYQTNMMVYGPGGYRFTDYLRAGIPLNVAVLTVITVVTVALA